MEENIKLFGATIALKQQHTDASEDSDPTADKRPEKVIPCPRCKSTETKFCYFNNYNVNQPRHFCRGCQRYWTAGGVLRNVPVGAGRRKTKPPFQGMSEDGCSFDGVGGGDFEAAAEHLFRGKRRRCGSDSQSC